MKITGIVITKDEEKNIEKCLKSLHKVTDELIVVDSYSEDNTVKIAEKLGAKVILNEFEGYKEQRNFAQTKAEYDWILTLDADEELSEKAVKEILEIKEKNSNEFSVYSFPRNLFFLNSVFSNTLITCERKQRLYDRSKCVWNGGNVHEKIVANGKHKKLKGFINHYMNDSIEDFYKKLLTYSKKDAIYKFKKGKKVGYFKIFSIAIIGFLKQYILKMRFIHGADGLVLTWILTNYSIAKYIKLYELNLKSKGEKNG